MTMYPPKARRKKWPFILGLTGLVVIIFGCLGVVTLGMSAGNEEGREADRVLGSSPQPRTSSAKPKTSGIGPGMWKIGRDVKAGEYVTEGANGTLCYWDTRGDTGTEHIREQGTASADGEQGTVTLHTGEYFKTSGCKPWKPVKGEQGGGVQKTLYYTSNLPSAWPVSTAISFLDQYTGASHYKRVSKCPAAPARGMYRCTKLRVGSVAGGTNAPIGLTTCDGRYCTITVDTRDATRSGQFNYATRKWLLVHELGHTNGLAHRKTCVTSMYQYRRCGSRVPPVYFDSAQRKILSWW